MAVGLYCVLIFNLNDSSVGFITDGNSKLVGSARLRQLRVRGPSCQTPDLVHFSRDCNAPYSWHWEDTGSYCHGWTAPGNSSDPRSGDPWSYQSEAELRASRLWGRSVLYRGGGYVAELGPDLDSANRFDFI